jgi:hypothetical protein
MNKLLLLVALILSLPIITDAQQPAAPPASAAGSEAQGRLPVKRVVLYKNGVGYFEHSARVRGTQELNIDFTTAQLNDVLKSLTVVDLGDGRITGVRFNSLAPLSERLKSLRLPLEENASRNDLLEALRGTRVEVRSGDGGASGKLLSVETKKKFGPKGEPAVEVTEVSLVTENGEVRSFELGPTTTVRIADRELSEEVGRYLNLIGSAKAMDLRRMTISAVGTGERDVFVSYISEVPVWKSTYRILLPKEVGAKPLIQGWAIVDNTIGEDWKDVQLSLVAGAPQSFVQNISQPYYVSRPVVPLPESVTLTPQTHEGTMKVAAPPPPPMAVAEESLLRVPAEGLTLPGGFAGGVLGAAKLEGTVKDPSGATIPGAKVTVRNEASGVSQSTSTNSEGYYRFSNIQAGKSILSVQYPGFNEFSVRDIRLLAGRPKQIDATLQVASVAQTIAISAETLERQRPEAEARAIGDQFEYDLKQKVTIGKNQSALVPILQAHVDAEKVTLWNEDSVSPLRALWLTNTTGMTLDAGSINVLEETFAGEGLLDAFHPGEKRLLSYAADPAVRISVAEDSSERPVSRVQINKGVMMMTKEERESKTYTIFDADDSPRQVIIEHPARPEWKLAGNLKPEESTASFHRFRVKAEPKKTAQLVVEEYRPETTQLALANLSGDEVAFLLEQKRVTPAMEQAFRRVLDQKKIVSDLDAQMRARQQEIESISSDQSRIRENMKALKGSAEEKSLVQRYTRELDSQEDRLAALRTEIGDLKAKREQARKQLDQIIAEISLDETF